MFHLRPKLLISLTALVITASSHLTGHSQMIVGHRGASYDAPENTMAAFTEAWKQAADGIEGDFYFTADKEIVCIHDEDTERTAGRNRKVASSTLAQLRELEYGNWKSKRFQGEPIPTIEDVIACVPAEKCFVIELKTGPEIVPILKPKLEKAGLAPEQILIIAFDEKTVAKSKELLPNIKAHWLTSYKQNLLTGKWRPSAEQIAQTVAACGADGVGMKAERAVVNENFIDELTRRGVDEFHVWTVDEIQDAEYFKKLGAIGITTNKPRYIRSGLMNLE